MSVVLLDEAGMKRTLNRMAHEILESNQGVDDLVVVGILRRGWPVAKRLAFALTQIEGATIPCGKIDISASRDDAPVEGADSSEIPFQINDKNVILVDEVVHTGRTVRAALEALNKFGRPRRVQLAALVDRGHRELPIQPDFTGRSVDTQTGDYILVKVNEIDGDDRVEHMTAAERAELPQ